MGGFRDLLDLSFNLRIWTFDAQGRKVQERVGHNIFLDNGKTWLGQRLSYNTTGYVRTDPPLDPEPAIAGAPYTRTVAAPLTTADVYMPFALFYIGVGIGGNQQSGPIPAAVDLAYPGTNAQSDADPTVPGLERPVRITLENLLVPTWARWLNPIQTTIPAPPVTYVRYTATFSTTDINWNTVIGGGNFVDVPLSEAALYCWTTDPDSAFTTYPPALAFTQGQALVYHTFPLISKNMAVGLVVQWDLLFGT